MANESWEHCMLEKTAMLRMDADNRPVSDSRQTTLSYYGERTFTDKLEDDLSAWEQAITQLGREGWEMVSANDTISDFGVNGHYIMVKLYFKRRTGASASEPMLRDL